MKEWMHSACRRLCRRGGALTSGGGRGGCARRARPSIGQRVGCPARCNVMRAWGNPSSTGVGKTGRAVIASHDEGTRPVGTRKIPGRNWGRPGSGWAERRTGGSIAHLRGRQVPRHDPGHDDAPGREVQPEARQRRATTASPRRRHRTSSLTHDCYDGNARLHPAGRLGVGLASIAGQRSPAWGELGRELAEGEN
jgi:hypothetical protein